MGIPEDLPPPYRPPPPPSRSGPSTPPRDTKRAGGPPRPSGKKRGCVIMHHDRLVTICEFPREVLVSAEGLVRQEWKRGVEEVMSGRTFFELRLSGDPWQPYREEAAAGQLLILHLLAHLATLGYTPTSSFIASTDSSPRYHLFFRPCESVPKPQFRAFCLKLHEGDKLRLLGFRSDDGKVLYKKFVDVCTQSWPPGIQRTEAIPTTQPDIPHYQIKLRGNPWHASQSYSESPTSSSSSSSSFPALPLPGGFGAGPSAPGSSSSSSVGGFLGGVMSVLGNMARGPQGSEIGMGGALLMDLEEGFRELGYRQCFCMGGAWYFISGEGRI